MTPELFVVNLKIPLGPTHLAVPIIAVENLEMELAIRSRR